MEFKLLTSSKLFPSFLFFPYSSSRYFSFVDRQDLFFLLFSFFFFLQPSFCVILDRVLFTQLFNCINFYISLTKFNNLIIKYHHRYLSRFLNTRTHRDWNRSQSLALIVAPRTLIQVGILFRMMRFGSNLGPRRGRIVGSSGVLGFQKSRN